MDSYSQVESRIDEVLGSKTGQDALQGMVDALQESFEHYGWTGIYLVEGDELVLAAWNGPQATEHVRIPVGQGVCGAAAASGETEVVDDVSEDPRYLMCFPGTRSEIVVPIKAGERVLGEIDIDSDALAAFTPRDREFLESVASRLAESLERWGSRR
ncbi:MAG: GAF domain-containing protein [Chloroflexota bacterium]|nr:GAF domain-containing protein [Chloroflexota bacterium]